MEQEGKFIFLVILISIGTHGSGRRIGGIDPISLIYLQSEAVKEISPFVYENDQREEIFIKNPKKKMAEVYKIILKRDEKKSKFDGKIRLLKNPFNS